MTTEAERMTTDRPTYRIASTYAALLFTAGALAGWFLRVPDPTPAPPLVTAEAEAPPVEQPAEPHQVCVSLDGAPDECFTGLYRVVVASHCPEYKVLSDTEAWARMGTPRPASESVPVEQDIDLVDIAGLDAGGFLAYPSLEALLDMLRQVPPDAMLKVGYKGADGDWHQLTEADLRQR